MCACMDVAEPWLHSCTIDLDILHVATAMATVAPSYETSALIVMYRAAVALRLISNPIL